MTTPLFHWLAAIRLHQIGPITFRHCLEHFKSIDALFSASLPDLEQIGLTAKQIYAIRNPNWKSAENDLRWAEKNNCQIISCEDDAYPTLLRETHGAPLVLYVQGNTQLLHEPQIAVVGSRHPTPAGIRLAEEFSNTLAQAGIVITSGLALGIDGASHRGALVSGKTIAVLGTGLQHVYPRSHLKLAEKIIENGALISEFPPNTPPKAQNFPIRNRVISGLSLGVLVIEAAVRSGSLITARFAAEQNRDVFAIPGSVHNPLARGCHQLIRQGAKLVETANDILEELGTLKATLYPKTPIPNSPTAPDLEPELQKIFTQIGYEVTALDVIILRSGLTAGEVSSMLLSLELMGYVHRVPGGYARTASQTV